MMTNELLIYLMDEFHKRYALIVAVQGNIQTIFLGHQVNFPWMENDMLRTLIIMWFDTHQWILSSLSGSDESESVAVLCSLEQVLHATALPSLLQRTGSTLDQTLEASLETSCHLDFFIADRKCNHRYFFARGTSNIVKFNLWSKNSGGVEGRPVCWTQTKWENPKDWHRCISTSSKGVGVHSCLSMINCLCVWFGGFIYSSMDESVLAIVTCVFTSFHSTIIY